MTKSDPAVVPDIGAEPTQEEIESFFALVDKFTQLANTESETADVTQLHVALLFASAQYSAHVATQLLDKDQHEAFAKYMIEQYAQMLDQGLNGDQEG